MLNVPEYRIGDVRLIKNLLTSIIETNSVSDVGPLAKKMALTVCMFPQGVIWDFLRIHWKDTLKLKERVLFDECYCEDDLTPLRVKYWLDEIRHDYPSGVRRVLNQMLTSYWREMTRNSKVNARSNKHKKKAPTETKDHVKRKLDMEIPVLKQESLDAQPSLPPLTDVPETKCEDSDYVNVEPVLEELEEPYVEVDEKTIHDILFPEMEYEPQEVADARDVQDLFED